MKKLLFLFTLSMGVSYSQDYQHTEYESYIIDSNSYCGGCPYGQYNRTLSFGYDNGDNTIHNVKFVARTEANNFSGGYKSNVSKDLRLYIKGSVAMDWNNNRILSRKPLYVNGEIKANSLTLLAESWADYVFEKDYNLMSLSELRSFIKTNKHLPDVPSEKEVKEKGFEIAKMNEILLKKIEELTLYVLDQDDKINLLSEKLHKYEKE